MTLRQIRTQLFLIIITFLLLVLGSFTASYVYIQEHDAEEIAKEIIHDHRMTVQSLTWMSLTEPKNPSIPQLRIEFENNLNLLLNEGLLNPREGDPYRLPNEVENAIHNEYVSIAQIWPDYLSQLDNVLTQPPDSPEYTESWLVLQSLERLIVKEIDLAVSAYDEYILYQHYQIELLLIGFILVAVPLVLIGLSVIRKKIVDPIALLNHSANQIKNGDLDQPVLAIWEDEVGELAHSMEAMRIEISANRQSLEEKVAERTHVLAVATKFSQEISRKMNEEEVVESAINQAKIMLNEDNVALCLLSEEGNCLHMVANGSGLLSSEKLEQPLIDELVLAQSDETQIINISDSRCRFIQSNQEGSCLSSSLQVAEKVIGEMCVLRDRNESFDENEIQAFSLLTNSAAIAIYNSRLMKLGQDQAKQSARLAERQNLAADLHDDLAQNLGVTKMQIGKVINSLIEKNDHENIIVLEKLKNNLDIANEQVREVISGLSTTHKNKLLSIREGIEAAIADFQILCDIPVTLEVSDPSWENVSLLMQRQLLLIVKESLVNIRRHANAKTVRINIFRNDEHLVLEVIDDGKGFKPDESDSGKHFGLKVMQARAERSGGKLIVSSEPAGGTSVKARFPLEPPK